MEELGLWTQFACFHKIADGVLIEEPISDLVKVGACILVQQY